MALKFSKTNLEEYKRIVMFLMTVCSLTLLTAAFACIWYHCYADIIVKPFFRRGNWLVVGIYALLLYLFTRIYGGYRIGHLKRSDVIYSAALSAICANGITYLQISLIGRRFMGLMPILFLTLLDVILIAVWAVFAQIVYRKLYPPYHMLLIYGNSSAEGLVHKMSAREDKYVICEAIDVSEGLDEVFCRVNGYQAVVICDVKSETRNKILKYCFDRSIRTYLTPKISDTIVRGAEEVHLFDTPLLLCRNFGLTFEQRFVKRCLDVLLSAAALILFSPFMLVAALAVKLYDGGPVLYRQRRCTQGGKTFDVYKFRSMVVDAEKEGKSIPATTNDPRITPAGRILRKLRLDELPQLINILKGEMSLVGPRPERIEHVEAYTNEIPEFSYRLKVKAGLTGYAQVIGKYNTSALDKLKLDLIYIENYSLLMDIRLILMTIKILFQPESTEGFDKIIPAKSTGHAEPQKEKQTAASKG